MRRSPVEAALTGIVATLQASTGVTGLVTSRVYNNVPQNTPYPYIEVVSPTDRRKDTNGRFGAETLVDVKAISQALGDQENARIIDQCKRALDFQHPTVVAHSILGLSFEDGTRFRDVVNGIVTRYDVATFRVWTEQSSS